MSTAQKFRKKPVEIEAMQWDGTVTEGQEIMHWAAKASGMTVPPEYLNDTPRGPVGIHTPRGLDPYLSIITLEGTMTARPGDFIIRGVQGVYPCKPDIFEQTYEEALTPTDDERAVFDAIADRLGEHSQATNYEIADSGEYETKLRGPVDVEVLAEWLLPTVLGFRRSEVPEPSTECPQPCVHLSQHDAREGRTCADHPCTCPEPQGEPSDAQVLAALNAYNDDSDAALRDWSPYKVNAMRAALRAAGGAQ